ncbi:hypothetical protein BH10BAC4_BH10BAC4_06420 [soil metagenome]
MGQKGGVPEISFEWLDCFDNNIGSFWKKYSVCGFIATFDAHLTYKRSFILQKQHHSWGMGFCIIWRKPGK